MISACIVSPAWGRLDVTRLALMQRQRLCVELASTGIDATALIVADDENLDLAAEYGCETVEAPNRPLGNKCNVAFRRVAELQPDYVVWIGSDDWIHPDVFKPLLDHDRARPAIFAGHKLSIVDLETGRLQRLTSPSKFGAIPWLIDGRFFNLHPKLDPIKRDLSRGLDGALARGLRRCRLPLEWIWDDQHDFRCVDFKSRRNLTPYEGLARVLGVGDPELAWPTLRLWYPADLVDAAERLSQEAAR